MGGTGGLDDGKITVPFARARSLVVPVRAAALKWRGTILIVAFVAFAVALFFSLQAVDFSVDQLEPLALGWLLLLLVPSLWINGVELQIAATLAGVRLGGIKALVATSWASLANFLPLPGGVVVRAGTLVAAGGEARRVGVVVAAGALVWVAMAIATTLFAVVPGSDGGILALAVLAAGCGLPLWMLRGAAFHGIIGLLAVRAGLLVLTILRLSACFSILGLSASLREASAYAGASLVGTVVGIVPAGLGVTEAVGSGLALLIGAPPAAAFVALAMNRLAGLLGAALIVLPSLIFRRS